LRAWLSSSVESERVRREAEYVQHVRSLTPGLGLQALRDVGAASANEPSASLPPGTLSPRPALRRR